MLKPGKPLALLLLLAQAAAVPQGLAAHAHKPLDIDLTHLSQPPASSYAGESPGGTGSAELPDLGDSTGTLFTPAQESQLGDSFFRSLHSQVEVNQDPEVAEYIQAIGQKLAASAGAPGQPFHFFVVNDMAINAFAGPGGYIGVNAGLILVSESESELASVLGHEIAHVTQRHLYQALQASKRIQLLSMAAMIAAMVVGAKAGGSGYQNQAYCTSKTEGCQRGSNTGQGAAVAAMAAGTQAMINFTRDNEAEADSIGMQILSRSDFDPRSMPAFFERMQQSTRFAGHGTPEFLLTHPVTVSRIADTRGRAEKFPYRQYPDSLPYQLIRAKLRVGSAQAPREAVEYFKNLQGQGTAQQQDVWRYGLALALLADSQFAEGKKILQALADAYPEQPHFLNALAKAEADQHNYPKAIELYAQARERFPGNGAIAFSYAQTLLSAHKPEPARRLLEELVHGVVSPDLYEALAQAHSGLGEEGESHRYLAEAYYADGQTRMAIAHLRLARKFSRGDFYLNAIIDERMRQFIEEENEMLKGKDK